MKLGKALATGVAEERPEDRVVHEDGPERHPELREEFRGELQGLQAPAAEEVPAAR
ncbi:hypothetical protein AB0M97_04160 [Streptomyces sp. NPDC051207]|uniref:hypothetical protein n=1 Tax=Streptomyces sp. NPDC051207 TaxID=3154641 RepID=UPI003431B78E